MNPSHAPFYVNFNLLFATNNIKWSSLATYIAYVCEK